MASGTPEFQSILHATSTPIWPYFKASSEKSFLKLFKNAQLIIQLDWFITIDDPLIELND